MTSEQRKQQRTVICGGGVVGITTAYELAKRGHKIVVLEERDGLARVASFRNGSLICPSLLTPWAHPSLVHKFRASLFNPDAPVKLHFKALFDRHLWKWLPHFLSNCRAEPAQENSVRLLKLATHSKHCFDQLTKTLGKRLAFEQVSQGTLQLATSPQGLSSITANSLPIASRGLPIEILKSAKDCVGKEPSLSLVDHRLAGGVFSSMDTNGDIHKFSNQLATVCREDFGVEFHTNEPVASFRRDSAGQRVTAVVTLSGKVFEADNVVIATGVQTTPLLARLGVHHVPVYPIKGYVVEVPFAPIVRPLGEDASATAAATATTAVTSGFVLENDPRSRDSKGVKVTSAPHPRVNVVDDANKLYISPLQNVLRISGMAEIAGFDTEVDETRARVLLNKTADWLPHHLQLDKATFTSCCRPLSPDDVPIIGRVDPFSNVFVNAGHGSKGWTLCFGAANVLADQIVGRKAALDLEDYSPQRFQGSGLARLFGLSKPWRPQPAAAEAAPAAVSKPANSRNQA